MKIGFDGKRAANNLTGLGNYSRSLIAGLARLFPQNQYFVYTQRIKKRPQISNFFSGRNITVRMPDRNSLFWRTIGIRKQLINDRIELYHGLSHEIPLNLRLSGIPAVVTIHDLIFLKFPQYYGIIDRFIYKQKCRHACKQADRIVAISECTKRDVITFFDIDPKKIDVVYQSCDDIFRASASNEKKAIVRQKFQLPEKYLLNVGTIEPRKNLLTLIRALPYISETHKLVVVGKATSYASLVKKEIDRLGLNSRVVFLRDVAFDELPSIYQMADIFIYPSEYEGFGIPVIEALYSGVPTIAAKGSCLEEAGGPDSIYVDPTDHIGFAKAVDRVLHDPDLAKQMKSSGLSYIGIFEQELLSRKMMDVYAKAVAPYTKS